MINSGLWSIAIVLASSQLSYPSQPQAYNREYSSIFDRLFPAFHLCTATAYWSVPSVVQTSTFPVMWINIKSFNRNLEIRVGFAHRTSMCRSSAGSLLKILKDLNAARSSHYCLSSVMKIDRARSFYDLENLTRICSLELLINRVWSTAICHTRSKDQSNF